ECCLNQAVSLVYSGLLQAEKPQLNETLRDGRIRLPEVLATDGERRLQHAVSPIELAKLLEETSKRLEQVGLNVRHRIQHPRLCHAPVKQRDHPKRVGKRPRLVVAGKEAHHELLNALRPLGLRKRGVACGPQLPGVE